MGLGGGVVSMSIGKSPDPYDTDQLPDRSLVKGSASDSEHLASIGDAVDSNDLAHHREEPTPRPLPDPILAILLL